MTDTPVPKATLVRLGRMIALLPGELGKLFEEDFEVTIRKTERPCLANGWRKRDVFDTNRLWWYQEDPITNQSAFCTLAGYETAIAEKLRALGVTVEIETRVANGLERPLFDRIRHVKLRDKQREMVIKQAVCNTGLFVLATGAGKSFFIKLLALIYPTATIVITVPAVQNARDLYDGLIAAGDVNPDEVGFVGDGDRTVRRVTVCVTHSIEHVPDYANLVIVDECHMVLTKRFCTLLNRFHRAKLLGFTASPEGKSDGSDGYMEPMFGRVLVEADYQESVANGSVVQLDVELYRCADGPDVSAIDNDDKREKLAIIRNPHRNALIAEVVRAKQAELGPDQQILVMVDKTEHAYILQQLLPDFVVVSAPVTAKRAAELVKLGAFDPARQKLCSASDATAYKKAYEAGTLKYAIATGVWERGVDFKDLACLVRTDAKSSIIKACQIPGRLARLGKDGNKEKGILIDFIDAFSKDFHGKSKRRVAAYKSHGWNIRTVS